MLVFVFMGTWGNISPQARRMGITGGDESKGRWLRGAGGSMEEQE
jgi:hypothetical protein